MNLIFDVETTGLNPDMDEILQFSAIDENYNVLFNSYIRPTAPFNQTWPNAERIHGITPDIVKDSPTFDDVREQIQALFDKADLLIAYNGIFDIKFLSSLIHGIKIPDVPCHDVMLEFAPIFGEYDSFYCNFKWQKLKTAAEFYGYKFQAHDSLEDVKATLYVFDKMRMR